MADEKRYIDLPGLQDYDKGVKDALSKLSTRIDNLNADGSQKEIVYIEAEAADYGDDGGEGIYYSKALEIYNAYKEGKYPILRLSPEPIMQYDMHFTYIIEFQGMFAFMGGFMQGMEYTIEIPIYFEPTEEQLNTVIPLNSTYYQEELVDGESIKTINGESVLGSGDLELAPKQHEHYTSDIKDVNTGFYLDELLDNKSSNGHTHEIKDIKDFFIGSYEEYEAAYNAGSIPVGAFVVITDDDEEDEASSPILGVGQLDSMILG